jgi:hypothetical protein
MPFAASIFMSKQRTVRMMSIGHQYTTGKLCTAIAWPTGLLSDIEIKRTGTVPTADMNHGQLEERTYRKMQLPGMAALSV